MAATDKTCNLMVNVFDGSRQPMPEGVELLVRLVDGFQNQVAPVFRKVPNILFRKLPFFDNNRDDYAVIVSADGYVQAGFTPVRMLPDAVQHIDLMLLKKDAGFNFAAARWDALKSANPSLVELFQRGASSEAAAQDRYTERMESRPATLAALLNITTAMAGILLPNGNPLGYLKELIWDDSMAQDRFFGFADQELVNQALLATAQGVFKPEFGTGLLHPGATRSFKQVQFGEANVQITFHEKSEDRRNIDGVDCVKVECDIDYFQDLAAHALLEVIPNAATGGLTDPKQVYVLRWIAGRHAGVAEFNPPYTIV